MAESKNEVTKAGGAIASAANKLADYYMGDVMSLGASLGMPIDEASKRCGVNAIVYLCGQYGASEVQSFPRDQLMQVLQFVTINGLDVFSGQVFMDRRKNFKTGKYDIKATPMGSAYETMVRRYGVGVKAVHQAWVIREGDEFSLPQYDGLKVTPARWRPTLEGYGKKAIAVCYPIEKEDGSVEYLVSTRDEVARNLVAQIMNATLGAERREIHDRLMKELDGKGLDEMIADPELAPYVSPAYRSPASRESMIVQKMKKNALLHYTRDLGSKAYERVNAGIDEAPDMVAKDVVAEADGEGKIEKTAVKDFSVSDLGEVTPAPGKEEIPDCDPLADGPEEAEKPQEAKGKEAPKEEGGADPFGME